MRALAYLRVSTDEQRLGPEAQRTAIEAWAAREGVAIVGWFVDQGVSGGSELDARPALVEALTQLRVTKAGRLLVAKRDRLAREVAVAALIDRAVHKAGAVVVSADGVGNGTAAEDSLMRTMLDAIAAYERALIRQRTRLALAERKKKGKRVGTVPYGFELAADGLLTKNEPEQVVIALVRRLRAEGLSQRAIVSRLAAEGVVSRAGRPLQQTQVGRILHAA